MEGHEDNGDVTGFDTHGKEETADLAEGRVGLDNPAG